MKKIVSLVCGLCICLALCAGEIQKVSAVYEYTSNNLNETLAEVEANAFERAKQKALEDKFGLDVNSVSNSLQINRASGNNAQTETNVFSLGGTAVRGEWIETISEEIIEPARFSNGFWQMKVRVVGRARNYSTEKTDIRYTFVRSAEDLESPVTFRDGNDIYLRFSSPVAGSLCVYLVDEDQNAFCLLPYANQQSGAQAIEANKDYVFFYEKFDKNADEYVLTCERSMEQNALYVVFSPNTFTKANDTQSVTNWRDQPMPRQLSYADLLKWLARNQTKDEAMVVRTSVISIRR